MRKAMAVAVICVAASFAVGQSGNMRPLNVKTGLWQMTQKIVWTNLPAQQAAFLSNGVPMSYQSCVKKTDLIENPWANGSGQKCTWKVLSSNGTDMEVQGVCDRDRNGMSMQMHGKIHAVDSENGTGSMDVTLNMNGTTANGHASYTGKWIAGTCPADNN